MTLQEINSKICDLRCEVENLKDEVDAVWRETENRKVSELTDYLSNELDYIAYRLSDIEDFEMEEDESEGEDGEDESEEDIDLWWDGLDNSDKSQLVGIPMPRHDDRGDDEYEFRKFCESWWKAKSLSQKREILEREIPWWDKE